MAMHMAHNDEFGEEAPLPVDASSVESGAFTKLEKGQGAVSAASKRSAGSSAMAEESTQPMDKRTMAIIVGGALAVIAIVVVLFVNILDAPGAADDQGAEPEQTAVAADESITSRGAKYELVENGGAYQLVEVHEGDSGQSVSLGDIPGTPVNLVLYDGALIIPENLSDGTWDVMAYTIGSGWSQIMDQEGNATAGSGTISEAQLEGSTVVLVVDGQRVDVPLVW